MPICSNKSKPTNAGVRVLVCVCVCVCVCVFPARSVCV